jgi:hypothetical protein
MSCHKFSNLREIFQGDLGGKIMEGAQSKDFIDRQCNCVASSKVNGQCLYGEKCRRAVVVYKATCKVCEKQHYGNTQQYLKLRINQHVGETVKLVNKGEKSDSFANHFAGHFSGSDADATRPIVREMLKVEIVWKGNPIGCMKTFGSNSCNLCMKERLAILNMTRKNPKKLINSRNEICGACRHKTRFHRFHRQPKNNHPSTDDGSTPERVLRDQTITPDNSQAGSFDFDDLGSFGASPSITPPPGDRSVCHTVVV